MAETEKTIVVFRKWKDNGQVIALFPTIPSDVLGWDCDSYEHVGQHGSADYHGVVQATNPVGRKETGPLKRELTRIGYRLVIRQRASATIHRQRMDLASEFKKGK